MNKKIVFMVFFSTQSLFAAACKTMYPKAMEADGIVSEFCSSINTTEQKGKSAQPQAVNSKDCFALNTRVTADSQVSSNDVKENFEAVKNRLRAEYFAKTMTLEQKFEAAKKACIYHLDIMHLSYVESFLQIYGSVITSDFIKILHQIIDEKFTNPLQKKELLEWFIVYIPNYKNLK